MRFRPSLRDVLPASRLDAARAVLTARQDELIDTPWFVRAFTGFGAWLASLFLMLFLGIALLFGKENLAIVMGLGLTVGAVMLRRTTSHPFFTQFILATGLCGQGVFLAGVAGASDSAEVTALATFVLQTVLLFVYADTVQRFLSALFASGALIVLLRLLMPGVMMDVGLVGIALLVHLLFLHQGTLQSRSFGAVVTPAAFGLVTTLLAELTLRTWFHKWYLDLADRDSVHLPAGVLTMGFAAVTLYSTWRVLEETGTDTKGSAGITVLATLALTAILTFQTPGVITTLGVLLLGFHRRNAVLLGMAVVFVLLFGVGYYYNLELSLLAKSLALLGSGLLLIGLRLFILSRFPAAEEVR